MRTAIIAVLLLVATSALAEVIPPERRIDWSQAGYQGEMPDPATVIDVTLFGAVGDGVADCTQAVNQAIQALGSSPGVIFFPAGRYKLTATIPLTSGVIFRGAGADQTSLQFNLNNAAVNPLSISGSASAFVSLTSGYTKGSTALVPSSVASFSPGDWAEIREDNGSWDTNPADWAQHAIGQLVHIQSINGGTLVLDTPLHIAFEAGLNPEIRKLSPKTNVGVESLKIERTDSPTGAGSNISFNLTVGAWIRGVESYKSAGSHVMINASAHVEVTGSYFHHAFGYDGSGTRGYGITFNDHATFCLAENNIFEHLRHAMMTKMGANGNVVAYNYSRDVYRDGEGEVVFGQGQDFGGDISLHGHFSFLNLFEGNIVQTIMIDHAWGPSGPYNTLFRNRTEHYGIVITSNTESSAWTSPNQNFVGNEVNPASNWAFSLVYGGIEYSLKGNGHFQYGNRVGSDIEPSGTTNLPETSYYLPGDADTCRLAAHWPPLGLPNALNANSIRARDRYLAGGSKTYLNLEAQVGNDLMLHWPEDVQLHGLVKGGAPPYTYQWSPATGLDNANAAEPWAAPDSTAEYRFTVTDAMGCTAEDTIIVTVTGGVAAPVFSPAPGNYYAPQAITLLCDTPHAEIRYTLNGSTPTVVSELYVEPLELANEFVIKAKAFREGWTPSPTVEGRFTVRDRDECRTGQDACSAHATCTNTWGGYECQCRAGFVGNGFDCAAICGDRLIVAGEDCDDGNTSAGDCCSPSCGYEPAGTVCGDAESACINADVCDGQGTCIETGLKPDQTPCHADSNGCTVGDFCLGGVCIVGMSPECSGLNDQCNTGVCVSLSADTFECRRESGGFEGDACDDENSCTFGEICTDGVCNGTDLNCDDQNPCTTDSCAPPSGCAHDPDPNGSYCDVENTGSRRCLDGNCLIVNDGQTCDKPISLTLGETASFTTLDGWPLNDASECADEPLAGPELHFILDPGAGFYRITVTPDVEADLAIVLIGDCDPMSCLDVANDGGKGQVEILAPVTIGDFAWQPLQFAVDSVSSEDAGGFTVLVEPYEDVTDGDEEETSEDECNETDGDLDFDFQDAEPEWPAGEDGDAETDEEEMTAEEDEIAADGDEATDGDDAPADGDASTTDGDDSDVPGDRDTLESPASDDTTDGDYDVRDGSYDSGGCRHGDSRCLPWLMVALAALLLMWRRKIKIG
ncbi:MAG: hypothetical protein C4523_04335 [Myxococcales bacterium]|nr:MAG: hypothetical protein C4523_04335 [Myxococcales bacterium]